MLYTIYSEPEISPACHSWQIPWMPLHATPTSDNHLHYSYFCSCKWS